MTFAIHGLAVAPGIAIGRAVIAVNSRIEVVHYFIEPHQVIDEIKRVRRARDVVVDELKRMQEDLPADAPHELGSLLDVLKHNVDRRASRLRVFEVGHIFLRVLMGFSQSL